MDGSAFLIADAQPDMKPGSLKSRNRAHTSNCFGKIYPSFQNHYQNTFCSNVSIETCLKKL